MSKEQMYTVRQRSGVPTIKEIFSDLEMPILEEALSNDELPSKHLPTTEQKEKAIKSKSIHSPQSKEVLEVYKTAYAHFGQPFPGLDGSSDSSGTSSANNNAEEQIIKAYFQGQLLRLEKISKDKGISVQDSLPSAEEIEVAAKSHNISSEESQAAIDKIRESYQKLDVPFHSPVSK